jgi:hypothetical protein
MSAPSSFRMTSMLTMPSEVEAELRVRRLGLGLKDGRVKEEEEEEEEVTINEMDTMGKFPCLRCEK